MMNVGNFIISGGRRGIVRNIQVYVQFEGDKNNVELVEKFEPYIPPFHQGDNVMFTENPRGLGINNWLWEKGTCVVVIGESPLWVNFGRGNYNSYGIAFLVENKDGKEWVREDYLTPKQ